MVTSGEVLTLKGIGYERFLWLVQAASGFEPESAEPKAPGVDSVLFNFWAPGGCLRPPGRMT